MYRGEADAWRGVSSHRFNQYVFIRKLGKLFSDLIGMARAGDNQDIVISHEGSHPVHRVLYDTLLTCNVQQVLWSLFSAQGPEPGPLSSRHDYRIHIIPLLRYHLFYNVPNGLNLMNQGANLSSTRREKIELSRTPCLGSIHEIVFGG